MFFSRKKKKKKRTAKPVTPRMMLIRQILLGIVLIALVVLLGIGVWYGSRVESLTITSVDVVGGETIDHARLSTIAEEELAGEYYRLVPKRFAWTYPEEAIRSRILEIERVKNVHVERTSGTSLAIAFEEYRPYALWCETLETDTCLFLDHEGYAFGHAPKLQGGAFVRFSERERVPERGITPFDDDFIKNAEAFIARAYDELNLNIIQVEKTTDDELVYHIAGGGELKVSLRMDSEETIDNLQTILLSDEFNHIAPGNFQYIDLRYGNKIFVNEELLSDGVATSAATTTVSEE